MSPTPYPRTSFLPLTAHTPPPSTRVAAAELTTSLTNLLGVRAHFAATRTSGHARCVRTPGAARELLESLSAVLRDLLRCSRVVCKEDTNAGKSRLGVRLEVVKAMYRDVLNALPKAHRSHTSGRDGSAGGTQELAQIRVADSVLIRLEKFLHPS